MHVVVVARSISFFLQFMECLEFSAIKYMFAIIAVHCTKSEGLVSVLTGCFTIHLHHFV